ncbi:hypothetical protein [Streptomyces sp. AC555_RSS877]|uniref:hypothetical protein n=1 Tax=Streptomyces sp. AC555_RSS877 TaxID=2823688 RepID=UPI001C2581BD|nr:hypothetical protein [Streptomyces sp. AC555_RSS877]
MTITMQNYGLTWTDADGMPQASAVAYDQASANRQNEKLEASGCSGIEIVPVSPGRLAETKA